MFERSHLQPDRSYEPDQHSIDRLLMLETAW